MSLRTDPEDSSPVLTPCLSSFRGIASSQHKGNCPLSSFTKHASILIQRIKRRKYRKMSESLGIGRRICAVVLGYANIVLDDISIASCEGDHHKCSIGIGEISVDILDQYAVLNAVTVSVWARDKDNDAINGMFTASSRTPLKMTINKTRTSTLKVSAAAKPSGDASIAWTSGRAAEAVSGEQVHSRMIAGSLHLEYPTTDRHTRRSRRLLGSNWDFVNLSRARIAHLEVAIRVEVMPHGFWGACAARTLLFTALLTPGREDAEITDDLFIVGSDDSLPQRRDEAICGGMLFLNLEEEDLGFVSENEFLVFPQWQTQSLTSLFKQACYKFGLYKTGAVVGKASTSLLTALWQYWRTPEWQAWQDKRRRLMYKAPPHEHAV